MLDPKALDAAFGRLTATLVARRGPGERRCDRDRRQVAEVRLREGREKLTENDGLGLLRLTLATVAAKDGDEVDAALAVLGLISRIRSSLPMRCIATDGWSRRLSRRWRLLHHAASGARQYVSQI
jgi:hypothetical protein